MGLVEKVASQDTVHIRFAQKEDLGAIGRLITLENMELPVLLRMGLYILGKLLSKSGVPERRLKDPNSRFLIAEDFQGIVGYLNGCILPDRNTGWVQCFYVALERRGGVIAKKLLSEFEESLKAQGIRDVEAQVLKNGRPHRLAKLTGWIDVQNIPDDEVHIWKSL